MIIAFRHGRFGLNVRSHLTGEAALQTGRIPPDTDAAMDLLPEGREQAARMRQVLAGFAIDACLRSPPLRAKTTAELALAGQDLPSGIMVVPELRERSRGKFSYAPDALAETNPCYPAKKSVLDWQPCGVDYNGNTGESIRLVRDHRVWPVLRAADEIAPSGTIALSTHAEWMLALRAYYLDFDDARFRRPLMPNPPIDDRAFTTAKMVVNGQIDLYDCTCPEPVPASAPQRHVDRFRTIGVAPAFDTGWLNITEMRDW